MRVLPLAICLTLHISFSDAGSARTGYWTEWAILLSWQINKEFLLLSLVFSGIFQRPFAHTLHTVTYHCTMPFPVAPEDVMLPRVSLSVSWPWRLQWGINNTELHQLLQTQSARVSARFSSDISEGSTQQSSVCSPAQHAQNWGVQPLRGVSQDLMDTNAHCRAAVCQNIQYHTQRATSMLRKWAQTKAHLQTSSCGKLSLHANDPSLYPRLNPRLSCKHL